MKKLLFIAMLSVSVLGYSQSNEKGTFHINLLGGFAFGGNVTDKATFENETFTSKFKFASGTYGLNVHYGLNDKMSVGLGVSTGAYILTNKDLTVDSGFGNTFATTMSLLNISTQGRYYVVNNDDFNFYGGVNLGFASATDKFSGITVSTEQFKASGLSYGLNTGINYYWGNVGGNVQLGYDGAALSGKIKDGNDSFKVSRSVGGISFMAGLAIKIN
jgi:hypothetical protein